MDSAARSMAMNQKEVKQKALISMMKKVMRQTGEQSEALKTDGLSGGAKGRASRSAASRWKYRCEKIIEEVKSSLCKQVLTDCNERLFFIE